MHIKSQDHHGVYETTWWYEIGLCIERSIYTLEKIGVLPTHVCVGINHKMCRDRLSQCWKPRRQVCRYYRIEIGYIDARTTQRWWKFCRCVLRSPDPLTRCRQYLHRRRLVCRGRKKSTWRWVTFNRWCIDIGSIPNTFMR